MLWLASLTSKQCIESIVNPTLVVNRRCLQSLGCEPAVYLPLDEENGQAIQSLDLPFLLRLSHLLRAPETHSREIAKNYERLKVELPFSRRRFQYIAGISRLTSISKSGLVQPELQLGIAHTTVLGIALVLNACLLAMEPTNVDLQLDALNIGREAVKVSKQLLQDRPKCMWFTPVALIASWIATDDPDITWDVFSTIREHQFYWADLSYMDEARMLKKQLLQLRVKASLDQSSGLFSNFGLCIAYGAQGSHQQGNHAQELFQLVTPDTRTPSFSMDPRTVPFSGQLSPVSDVRQWNPGQ